MPVPSTLADVSITPSSNSPAGSESRSTSDDYHRNTQAMLKSAVSQGADIASASSLALPAAGAYFDITGTTTISAISSTNSWDGREVELQFDGALTLVHSSSLYLGGQNIITAAGQSIRMRQSSSGVWKMVSGLRYPGTGAIVASIQGWMQSSWVNVKAFFGAKGDGSTDDTAAIQAAIDALATVGGAVYFPPGEYKITDTLLPTAGVSLLGAGSTAHYLETDNVVVTTLLWAGAASGTMLDAGQRYQGRISGFVFDGAGDAETALNLGAPQSSLFRDLVVKNTASGTYAIIVTTTGQFYPDGTTQYPSAGFNRFECIICHESIGGGSMLWDGTLSGTTTVGAITENTVRDSKFTGASGADTVVLNKCCDTNSFYNCAIDSQGAGVALVLNFSATNNGTFGNNFHSCAIENLSASGTGVDARNNAFINFFYGCFWPSQGTVYTSGGGGGGKVKMVGATLSQSGGSFAVIASPVAGASPWTYTNTNPYAVEFRLWGGTTTAVSHTRNGSPDSIGGINTNLMTFYLEPGDALTITYSAGAPTAQAVPH